MVGCTSEGSLQEETGLRLAREDVGRLAERGEGKCARTAGRSRGAAQRCWCRAGRCLPPRLRRRPEIAT